jgi:dTDP-4-amino-4,6-dideoxygalactose transaminase
VDVDPESFTLDPARLEAAIGPKTRAILPVHLYGQAADMDAILAIARRRGIPVVEDACQAHGARYRGRRVGSLGDIGCFSFYPGKNIGACGEGGIAVTQSAEHARTMRMLRDWGQDRKYNHVLRGYNYRMDGIQGAILRVKLRRLDAWNEARRGHAALYDQLLERVEKPQRMPWGEHVYHLYAVRSPRRDELSEHLGKAGVATGIHYPTPVHHADLGHRAGDFPVSERLAREVLSLPMYPELTPEQIETVSRLLNDAP